MTVVNKSRSPKAREELESKNKCIHLMTEVQGIDSPKLAAEGASTPQNTSNPDVPHNPYKPVHYFILKYH